MAQNHLTLVLVALTSLTLGACQSLLKTDDAEKAISDHFNAVFPVEKVKCPAKIPLKKDGKFVCQVRFKGGAEDLDVDATITEVSSSGGKFNFLIRQPVFDPTIANAQIAESIEKQRAIKATVDCGVPRKPKAVDTCTATGPDGVALNVEIKVDPDGKASSFEVK